MEQEIRLDREKVSNCIKSLTEIDEVISAKGLEQYFYDIEELFKDINFIHANCLEYKESLRTILENLDYVKRKINYLTSSLTKTYDEIVDQEELTSTKLLHLSQVFEDTTSRKSLLAEARNKSYLVTLKKIEASASINSIAKEVTKIPPVETPQANEESSGINTVPIGIAIGATGVLSSLGAIAVNEFNDAKKKNQKKVVKKGPGTARKVKIKDDYSMPEKKGFIASSTPYQASRHIREAEKYYGIKDDNNFPNLGN